MPDDFFDAEMESEFPGLVRAAAIIWIVIGAIIQMLNLAILGVLFLARMPDLDEVMLIAVGVSVFFLVAGSLLLYVGIESVIGKARDTLATGIGSLIYGGSFVAAAVWYLQYALIIVAGVVLVCAIALLAAGVLALSGRARFKAWRRDQGH